jgi:uncharacterized protein (DUF952 family)/GNAT superfamily N-acetyltransferase
MRTLFHITTQSAWKQAQVDGQYVTPSLESEGFIHFSRPHQVLKTASRFFKGQTDLALLQISEEKLNSPIKYELSDGENFPHLYGPLNLDAVITAHAFDVTQETPQLPMGLTLIDTTLIRIAHLGDESELASAHTHAWMQSYRGLVPDALLDGRPLNFRNRQSQWRYVLSSPPQPKAIVAESADHGIIGFCTIEPARDEWMQDALEIPAFYLLDGYKGKGMGAGILLEALQYIKARGSKRAYLWVLKNNSRAITFYQKLGGKLMAQEKTVDIGGPQVEVGFEWKL